MWVYYVKPTCIVLIALGGLTQQLCDGRAHSFSGASQILGAFLQLNPEKIPKTQIQPLFNYIQLFWVDAIILL